MKKVALIAATLVFCTLLCGCAGTPSGTGQAADQGNIGGSTAMTSAQSTIPAMLVVGDARFALTLEGNETSRAFADLLPGEFFMKELNGNEKYATLSNALPTDAHNVGKIEAGDVMLYGDDTVVVFYESFSTTYSYTRLGEIDDPAGLADALGAGDVTVAFALA